MPHLDGPQVPHPQARGGERRRRSAADGERGDAAHGGWAVRPRGSSRDATHAHKRINQGGDGRTPGTPLANVSDVPPRAFGRTPGNKGKRTAGPKKKPAKKPRDQTGDRSGGGKKASVWRVSHEHARIFGRQREVNFRGCEHHAPCVRRAVAGESWGHGDCGRVEF